jgi:ABC-type uncharacterized transport system involved in gliding motility auxiliary subunit
MNVIRDHNRSQSCAGTVLATTLHVVLLVFVLGEIVYLASRNRTRVDLTSDQLWTSTDSTRRLIDKLDKQLVVEAYFSPKEKLPVMVRETRAWAESFLDELVQLGKGKVVVQRFDPNADKAVADKATRVGIKPLELRSQTSTSLSVDRHWQGLRLVYGGGKQKAIAQFAPGSSFLAEAVLTPAIKEVMTEQKRKFGYMEWPATNPGGAQQGGLAWNTLRTIEGIAKRYDFQNFKDEDGALLPADLDTLFLFRPKDLTDRQKYVLDQFVVKGGTLVGFVDAAEYLIGQNRAFTRIPFAIDAAGGTQKFTDQLLHYGVDWRPKVLADMERRTHSPANPLQAPYEYFAVPFAGNVMSAVPYPYFFHPVAEDWSRAADELAKDAAGKVDKEQADQYRKLFGPGMPSDEFLFKAFKDRGRGPGFYWPTWVGLRQKAGGVADLPPDVQGRVLLWSSPAVLVEDPPQNLNPIGMGDGKQREAEYAKFNTKLGERFRGEPRQQAPLMVDVKGRFSSFFAGQDRPKRPSEIKEEAAKKAAGEPPKVDDPATDIDESKPNADQGPPAPAKDVAAKDAPALAAEPVMVTTGERPGRILLIGDADFLRDDLVGQVHARAGGPYSGQMAAPFFAQLLDWLAEDSDLVALQSKSAVDRTLKFVETSSGPGADPRLAEQALRTKTTWLRTLNVLVPTVLLAAFGLCVFLYRRQQKRSFLSSLA